MIHFNTYRQASNGTLNINKSQVITLSGDQIDDNWHRLFHDQAITEIFDRTSPLSLTYLGFPMIQSKVQSKEVENHLLQTIDQSLQPHASRGLTYRGRATVANTLVLSQIWHSLRLFHPSATFFDRLDSKISNFISANRKLGRFSIDHMKRPITEGGLGVIDPRAQHQALQLRWATPMLTTNCQSPTTVAVSWLKYIISFATNVHSYRGLTIPTDNSMLFLNPDIHLFLPSLRKRLRSSALSTFSHVHPLIKCISNLPDPRTQSLFFTSPAVALELPINDVWFATSDSCPIVPKSYNKIFVKDFYRYDEETQRLSLRLPSDPLRKHPILANRFHNALQEENAYLHPFLLHLCLPALPEYPRPLGDLSSCFFTSFTNHFLKLDSISSREYRKAISVATPLKYTTVNRLSSSNWNRFWKTKPNFKIKNIWFQLLHNKVNTTVNLFKFLPNLVSSPLCPLCSEELHHPEHMFVTCQRVWQIWKQSFQYLFPQDYKLHLLAPNQVLTSLYSLCFPPLQLPILPTPFLFGSILEGIWRHYWRFIFDKTPFIPGQVVCTSIKLFDTYVNQNRLRHH